MTGHALTVDIAIVGGGLAGSALAALLGGSGLKVALIERQGAVTQWPTLAAAVENFDSRVSALTLHSRQLLQRAGAWEAVAARRIGVYRHMHVWDAEGTGAIDFDAAEVNQPALGYIVENGLLHIALSQQVATQANIQPINETAVERIDLPPAGTGSAPAGACELALADGRRLRASLVVAADGANSRIRQWAGFRTREWDYGHRALVATVRTERGHEHTAWQRFLPEGPLALLPLGEAGEQFCSIVWSAEQDMADQLMALDDAAFCGELGRAFEYRLGAVTQVSPRRAFPLRQRHATEYTRPGLALVADAAHTIHPLAGQGINLGFKDVEVLAEELLRAVNRGLLPGDASVLARYQRRRKGDNLAMMAAMDGFKRLFGSRDLGLRWLRNTGLRWVDRSGALKRQIIRRAIGV